MKNAQQPFSGIYRKADGSLVDMFSGEIVSASQIKHNLPPFNGVFLDKDGNRRCISELGGGAGDGIDTSKFALRSDGQVLRMRISGLNQVISATPWAFLQGRTLESIVIPAQTNADLGQWGIDPATGALTFPSIDAYVKYDIDIRISGTSSIAGNNSAAIICEMLRLNAQTVAIRGRTTVTGAISVLDMESIFIPTFSMDAQDPYIVGGVVPRLFSGVSGNITQIDIVIQKQRH